MKNPRLSRYSRTGVGHDQRYLGFAPLLAAWLVGRRWRMVSGLSGMQLEASAYFDHEINVPTATMSNGAKRTLLRSGPQRAETPPAPGGSRMRSGGFARQRVDDGRVSKLCSVP